MGEWSTKSYIHIPIGHNLWMTGIAQLYPTVIEKGELSKRKPILSSTENDPV
jgi:hypothetical protein